MLVGIEVGGRGVTPRLFPSKRGRGVGDSLEAKLRRDFFSLES